MKTTNLLKEIREPKGANLTAVNLTAVTEKMMTVREVAMAMGVSTDTVKNCIRRIMPNKMQNGKISFLNESEVALIKKDIFNNTNVQQQIDNSGKFMTIRNVADSLDVSYSSVHRAVCKLFPDKTKNGKLSMLNEIEVSQISRELKTDYHTAQLTFSAGEKVKNTKWYTIEELAELCGISTETLKKGDSPLSKLSIDFKVESRLGGYHNTQKFYSENVLKALKEYQIKNGVSNATKDKGTVIQGNVSFIQNQTVKQAINNLLDNPQTLQMLLNESLSRQQSLQIENKMMKDIISEQKPKIIAFDRIAGGRGCFTMNQAAKALKLPYGNRTLFKKLQEFGILNQDNTPRQEQINNGNFKVVVKFINDTIGNKNVTLVTSKGLTYLAKKFNTTIDESVKADYED